MPFSVSKNGVQYPGEHVCSRPQEAYPRGVVALGVSPSAADRKPMPKMALFRFRYFDPIRGRRLVTRHVLSESDAKERYGANVEKSRARDRVSMPQRNGAVRT